MVTVSITSIIGVMGVCIYLSNAIFTGVTFYKRRNILLNNHLGAVFMLVIFCMSIFELPPYLMIIIEQEGKEGKAVYILQLLSNTLFFCALSIVTIQWRRLCYIGSTNSNSKQNEYTKLIIIWNSFTFLVNMIEISLLSFTFESLPLFLTSIMFRILSTYETMSNFLLLLLFVFYGFKLTKRFRSFQSLPLQVCLPVNLLSLKHLCCFVNKIEEIVCKTINIIFNNKTSIIIIVHIWCQTS